MKSLEIEPSTSKERPVSIRWVNTGIKQQTQGTIDAYLGYATRIYRKPEGGDAWKALYVQRTLAADTRGGLNLPLRVAFRCRRA
jgi:hypothetical protein